MSQAGVTKPCTCGNTGGDGPAWFGPRCTCAQDEALLKAALEMIHGMTEDAELIAAELGIEYWAAWETYL